MEISCSHLLTLAISCNLAYSARRGLTNPSYNLEKEVPEYDQDYFHFIRGDGDLFGSYALEKDGLYWFYASDDEQVWAFYV